MPAHARTTTRQGFAVVALTAAAAAAAAMPAPSALAEAADPPLPLDAPWIGYATGEYPTGLKPVSSCVGDFNDDGMSDVATAGRELAILMGDGKGGFHPRHTISLPLASGDIACGDFDNDDDLDIVLTDTGAFSEGTTVSYFRNDGRGGFTLEANFDTGVNGPQGITAADFNGDGFLDIAVAHDDYIVYGQTIAVLLNTGGQGFGPPGVYVVASATVEIASGDIDGDGDPDLAVAHQTNRFTIMLNTPGGFIIDQVVEGTPSGAPPSLMPNVHLFDVDNDDDLDVLFSTIDTGGFGGVPGAMGLWRNDGEGGLSSPEVLSFSHYTNGAVDVLSHDITGDGWPDLIASTDHSGYWFLFEGDGAGGFLAPRGYRAGQSPVAAEAGDLDGDGDDDVMILARDSLEVCVFRNPGDGNFIEPAAIDMSSPQLHRDPTNLVSGDIDGDGDLDLVSGSSEPGTHYQICVRRNLGDGAFGPRELYDELQRPSVIRLADLDADADLDLVWIDHDYRVRTRLNAGDGTFPVRHSSHTAGTFRYFKMHDVDNDGDPDLVKPGFFTVQVLKNNGDGTFAAPMETNLDTFFGRLALADFNEDGIADLLMNGGEQGYPRISLGVGNGVFGQPQTLPTGRSVSAFAVDDLDGDGHLDFVCPFNLDGGGLSVRRGRGDGNFFPPVSYPGGYDEVDTTSGIDLADIDGDGFADAVVAGNAAQELWIWPGNGDGTFDAVRLVGVGEHAWDIEARDFTGDGSADVAVMVHKDVLGLRNYPAVILLRNTGPPAMAAPLSDFDFAFGTHIGGGLAELAASDDTYVAARSQFGFSAQEPNIIDLVTGFESPLASPNALDFAIEARLNNPGGNAKVRIKNWNSRAFEQVGTFTTQQQDTVHQITNIDPSMRVRASDNRIELSTRISVIATFSAAGFDAWFDATELEVR